MYNISIRYLGCRGSSIKTRIETHIAAGIYISSNIVAEVVPLKQGLKPLAMLLLLVH